jgi:hypothetical protein
MKTINTDFNNNVNSHGKPFSLVYCNVKGKTEKHILTDVKTECMGGFGAYFSLENGGYSSHYEWFDTEKALLECHPNAANMI